MKPGSDLDSAIADAMGRPGHIDYDNFHPSTDADSMMTLIDFVLDHDGPYADYKMTCGIEYSRIVDWCASFCPGRNHPRAREYAQWYAQSTYSMEHAVCLAFLKMKDMLAQPERR